MSLVPFDDRDGWIWLDGQFVAWREAKVHVLTHGLHYASSVFEGERMYGGEIYKLTEHTQRLFQSAEILDFEIPFTVAEIDQACKDTCAKNGLTATSSDFLFLLSPRTVDFEGDYLAARTNTKLGSKKSSCKVYVVHSLFSSARKPVMNAMVALQKDGCTVKAVVGCGPPTRPPLRRKSSTGAMRTWPCTRRRARCSSWMCCPRAAVAR